MKNGPEAGPWRRNQYVGASIQLFELLIKGNATDQKRNRQFMLCTVGCKKLIRNLCGQFARWRQD